VRESAQSCSPTHIDGVDRSSVRIGAFRRWLGLGRASSPWHPRAVEIGRQRRRRPPRGVDEWTGLARLWAFIGMQTSDKTPKPASAVWDGFLRAKREQAKWW